MGKLGRLPRSRGPLLGCTLLVLQFLRALHIAETPNLLPDAIFIDFHFLRTKVSDRVVMFVTHHQVKKHFAGGRMDHRGLFGWARGRGLSGRRSLSSQSLAKPQSAESDC